MSIAAITACSASSLYGGRRSRYGSRPWGAGVVEYSSGKLDVFPGRAFPGRIPEKRGWMVGNDERNAIIAMDLAAKLADRGLGLQQSLRGKRAECQNHLWPDQLDLADQVGRAGCHFLGQGISVSRGPVLEDVHDE